MQRPLVFVRTSQRRGTNRILKLCLLSLGFFILARLSLDLYFAICLGFALLVWVAGPKPIAKYIRLNFGEEVIATIHETFEDVIEWSANYVNHLNGHPPPPTLPPSAPTSAPAAEEVEENNHNNDKLTAIDRYWLGIVVFILTFNLLLRLERHSQPP
jgi:hypothetical protein